MLCCANFMSEVLSANYDYLQETSHKETPSPLETSISVENPIDKIMEYYKKELLKDDVMELALEEIK